MTSKLKKLKIALLAHWSVCQKLSHVSSVQSNRSVRALIKVSDKSFGIYSYRDNYYNEMLVHLAGALYCTSQLGFRLKSFLAGRYIVILAC